MRYKCGATCSLALLSKRSQITHCLIHISSAVLSRLILVQDKQDGGASYISHLLVCKVGRSLYDNCMIIDVLLHTVKPVKQ